jgi:hypothetical protein
VVHGDHTTLFLGLFDVDSDEEVGGEASCGSGEDNNLTFSLPLGVESTWLDPLFDLGDSLGGVGGRGVVLSSVREFCRGLPELTWTIARK